MICDDAGREMGMTETAWGGGGCRMEIEKQKETGGGCGLTAAPEHQLPG